MKTDLASLFRAECGYIVANRRSHAVARIAIYNTEMHNQIVNIMYTGGV